MWPRWTAEAIVLAVALLPLPKLPAMAAADPAAHASRPGHETKGAEVVFMGDSITELWAAPRFGGFFPGKDYLNRGVSSQTTGQMLQRFRQDVVLVKPRAVVILGGTNDIAGAAGPTANETIEANLAAMSESAKAAGISVVLASILPVTSAWNEIRPQGRIREINAWLRAYCKTHDGVYLDYYSAMSGSDGFLKRQLTEDGVHPSAEGYAVMKPLAESAIATALSGSPRLGT